MKFQIGSIYYIEWKDHWGTTGWQNVGANERSEKEYVLCRSLGWCVDDGKEVVVLAATLDSKFSEDSLVSARQGILKNCISDYWEVTNI